MTNFSVRVELHGATWPDYNTLHERMEAAGFSRSVAMIGEADGRWHNYKLPTAEYVFTGATTSQALRNQVQSIANAIRSCAWVYVVEVASSAISSEIAA